MVVFQTVSFVGDGAAGSVYYRRRFGHGCKNGKMNGVDLRT
jgi:hypothetical protein